MKLASNNRYLVTNLRFNCKFLADLSRLNYPVQHSVVKIQFETNSCFISKWCWELLDKLLELFYFQGMKLFSSSNHLQYILWYFGLSSFFVNFCVLGCQEFIIFSPTPCLGQFYDKGFVNSFCFSHNNFQCPYYS